MTIPRSTFPIFFVFKVVKHLKVIESLPQINDSMYNDDDEVDILKQGLGWLSIID